MPIISILSPLDVCSSWDPPGVARRAATLAAPFMGAGRTSSCSQLQFPRTSVVEETGVDSIDAAARPGGRIRGHTIHAVEHIHATRAATHARSIISGAELLA